MSKGIPGFISLLLKFPTMNMLSMAWDDLLAFAKEEDEEFILGKVEAFEEDDAENNEDGPELVVDVSEFIQIYLRLE